MASIHWGTVVLQEWAPGGSDISLGTVLLQQWAPGCTDHFVKNKRIFAEPLRIQTQANRSVSDLMFCTLPTRPSTPQYMRQFE